MHRALASAGVVGSNNSENMNIVAENELEAAVQEKFREWLVSSGQIREVADLIGLERQK